MQLYAGCDLHSTNNYWSIIDNDSKQIFSKKVPCNPKKILKMLGPFKPDLAGIAVESTYNWYWMVDLLMDEGYPVYLANPVAEKSFRLSYKGNARHIAQFLLIVPVNLPLSLDPIIQDPDLAPAYGRQDIAHSIIISHLGMLVMRGRVPGLGEQEAGFFH